MLVGATSPGWFLENAWLIPVIPGIAAVAILLLGKRLGRVVGHGSYLGIAALGASLVLAAGTAYQWITRVEDSRGGAEALGAPGRSMVRLSAEGGEETFVGPVIRNWTWWQSGGVKYPIGTQIDGLSVTLLFVVALIAFLILVYSLEYVKGDRRFTHFYFAMTLFAAGMLTMVAADNMVTLLLGWEIMGVCSFMLIGHWWEEYPNARAALKAFFTTRTADIGMLCGIAILFFSSNGWITENMPGFSGFSIAGLNAWALSGSAPSTALFMGALALFVACIGKSGQFPLHTWLPDAMAGPTPVSALLHSSTMVVAGVYLVARLFPIFFQGFDILDTNFNVIVVIAAITIVISALLAFVQADVKKVLAYSTVSQLGYMMLGLGAGAWLPAVFHIFTHAFFKASLFLSAGSVSHSASHHSFDMKEDMGGLRKVMPVTFACWSICALALAGVFPLSGFFSKDEIIDNVGHNGYVVFQWVALGGAFLTAAYMARATYLIFFGSPRGAAAGHAAHADAHDEGGLAHDAPGAHGAPGDDVGGHDAHDAHSAPPHESNSTILVPILVLTGLAVVAGFLNATAFNIEKFKEWVEPVGVEIDSAELDLAAGAPVQVAPFDLAMAPVGAVGQSIVSSAEEGEELSGCGYEAAEQGICTFPVLPHAEFSWAKAGLSLAIVGAGLLAGFWFSYSLYGRRNPNLVGLTGRNPVFGAGYTVLENKYYLDALYEKIVVAGISGPIARATYWSNQKVIDAAVNQTGKAAVGLGRFTYTYVDQGVVDRTVDGTGEAAESGGKALQPIQSGKVAHYAAWLFGAAALGALILVLTS